MKHIRGVAIIAALTVALYAFIDWSYGRLFPLEPFSTHPERLKASAYVNEPYFSEAFRVETSIQQSGGLETPRGTRLLLPHPYRGKYFNVDILTPTGLPYRRTLNSVPAGKGARIVLLIGGSTLHNLEVPDELTVASQLAKILDARGKEKFYVVNAGVFSANTIQERERLQLELDRGLRPDIVVSLNGSNDVAQGVYFGDPEDVMLSSEKRNQFKEWLKSMLPLTVLPLNIYRSFRIKAEREKPRVVPPHVLDPARVARLARETADVYQRNLRAMHASGVERGFQFYSVLQPNFYSTVYTHAAKDIDEVEQLTNHTLPQVRIAFAEGYRALHDTIRPLRGDGVRAFDATGLFRDKIDSIFLDAFHVNSIGNRMLAEYIGTLILTHYATSGLHPATVNTSMDERHQYWANKTNVCV